MWTAVVRSARAPCLRPHLRPSCRSTSSAVTSKKQNAGHNPEFHVPPVSLTFLGTSSMSPQSNRNASGIALKFASNVWMFDCGEGSQRQIARCVDVGIGNVSKIFVTHMHGDHVMGIPGLLCSLFGHASSFSDFVEIFGPPGLRQFIRYNLHATYANATVNYVVHELHGWDNTELPIVYQAGSGDSMLPRHKKEGQGLDILPQRISIDSGQKKRAMIQDGRTASSTSQAHEYYWELPFSDDSPEADKFSVVAAPLLHNVPCVGYVVTEKDIPGNVQISPALKERLNSPENVQYCLERGLETPWKVLRQIKEGKDVMLADGELRAKDIVSKSIQGRRISILGDTCNSVPLSRHCVGSDVLVHEATNCVSHIPASPSPDAASKRSQKKKKKKSAKDMALNSVGPLMDPPPPPPPPPHLSRARRAKERQRRSAETSIMQRSLDSGHSTPAMAGQFATDVGAEKLILTHFSPKLHSSRSRMVRSHIVAVHKYVSSDVLVTRRLLFKLTRKPHSPAT